MKDRSLESFRLVGSWYKQVSPLKPCSVWQCALSWSWWGRAAITLGEAPGCPGLQFLALVFSFLQTAIVMVALALHGVRSGPDFFKGDLPYTVFAGVLVAQFSYALVGILYYQGLL